MKLWCTRDKSDGIRAIWCRKPKKAFVGEAEECWDRAPDETILLDEFQCDTHHDILRALFPTGLKHGDYVSVTVNRFVADKKGKKQ